jgi:hypothetical protein
VKKVLDYLADYSSSAIVNSSCTVRTNKGGHDGGDLPIVRDFRLKQHIAIVTDEDEEE